MPDLRETRRKVRIAIGAMIAVDVVAVAIMVSPLVGSTASRKQELNQLWLTLQAKTHQVEPLRGLDKKIPLASQQIDQFYKDRFPSHDSEVAEAFLVVEYFQRHEKPVTNDILRQYRPRIG